VVNLFLHFEAADDRAITAMTLMQHGKAIRFVREK